VSWVKYEYVEALESSWDGVEGLPVVAGDIEGSEEPVHTSEAVGQWSTGARQVRDGFTVEAIVLHASCEAKPVGGSTRRVNRQTWNDSSADGAAEAFASSDTVVPSKARWVDLA